MIKQAVDHLNGSASYREIKNYINSNWNNVNQGTITAQITALTVNSDSRIHYPENNKPRLTISGSRYDLLYNAGWGKVVTYDPSTHGIWEIYNDSNNRLRIQKVFMPDTKIFTPNDIIWFKNVSNTLDGEAYLSEIKNEFILHFPTKHKGNVLSPAINELILIYQKVHGIKSFTHLVTPIDNILDDSGERPEYKFGRRVKVIAQTPINNIIEVASTEWKNIHLSGVSQGNACEIDNMKGIESKDLIRLNIWNRFADFFLSEFKQSISTTSSLISELSNSNPELSAMEGELKLISHLVKERDRKIVNEKKQQALSNNTLFCEACSFSFAATYHATFIECHHLTPISEGGVRETKLEDLALVCANCHRMLHLKFDGQYLQIDQLKNRINSIQNDLTKA